MANTVITCMGGHEHGGCQTRGCALLVERLCQIMGRLLGGAGADRLLAWLPGT